MTISTESIDIINTILFVIAVIARLGGVAVAIILVARRATPGRWLVLVGLAIPAFISVYNGLTFIAFGATGGLPGLNGEGDVALTVATIACTAVIDVVAYVILLIGIWLLAHEGRAAKLDSSPHGECKSFPRSKHRITDSVNGADLDDGDHHAQ